MMEPGLADLWTCPRCRVAHYGGRDWVYYLRISSLDDLDEEIQRWLCRSYEVGCQRP